MKITDNKFVAASYDLYVGGEDGQAPELMEKATEEMPLTFVFGTGMMLESFESKLKNLQAGDSFDFVLPCNTAYGEYEDERVAELPKSIFEVEGKFDTENIAVDKMVPMMTAEGQRLDGMVLEITDEIVRMDFNHPLAGEDLHFVGKVLEVREATDEEMEQLMGSCAGCGQDCSEEHDASHGCGGCCC
ncbi:MAG: FKBP-type peptidyl-prolyl cis-trans isomerase [Bacteroidales bacterium]|nr:FKBP-type peptidyl-prolyl cis-trans isomerase [Bacteroidales bacterium]MDD3431075.1 FKBP-type peptidyl-prolyl cis-trans isomerase [Bacteroidales bacterium]MDD4361703.1 FKBP-type peptidyl-prolyl cis-trans isomerase [Bacteroidales bacterium]